MELLIVRHALPKRVVVEEGAADPQLDDLGHLQAAAVAEYLAAEGIDAVWSSPMRRARETAQPLLDRTGLTVSVDNDLAEWDRDSNSYIPIEELKATNHPMWQAMMAGEWVGSSDPVTFQKNVVAAMNRIIDAHSGERVAVVCHGGVIGAYLAHILELPRPGGFFHPEYTSIHRVMASSRGHRTLRTINELTHLHGRDLLPTNRFV